MVRFVNFLEAADCEVSIVTGGGRGQAGRHYLDKRNEAVKMDSGNHEALKGIFHARLRGRFCLGQCAIATRIFAGAFIAEFLTGDCCTSF